LVTAKNLLKQAITERSVAGDECKLIDVGLFFVFFETLLVAFTHNQLFITTGNHFITFHIAINNESN